MPRIGRSRPASSYKVVRPVTLLSSPPGVVALTTPNVTLAAPLLSPSGSGTVALTAPNVTLAAPLPVVALAIPLTTPNVALAAPLVTPSGGGTVALTTPNVALAAPLPSPSAGQVIALTAPGVALGAPLAAPYVPPPFPQVPLDLQCDLELGGTWTGVSRYVYQRDGGSAPVTVTRGKPDETQQASPSGAAWQWNNRDGRFSPKNPLSPYYGQLTRNTPVRFSVPATSNYLRLEADSSDCALTPDNAALHVTGSLEMRWHGRLSGWQGSFLCGRLDGVSTGSFGLLLRGDGTLRFFWYDSGNTEHQAVSDAPVPYTGGDLAVKVTLDATTGTVTWYTAATIDGTYAQLGDAVTVTGSATTIRAGSDPLRCGWSPGAFSDIGTGAAVQAHGRVYEVRLYSGIGGTLKADGQFSEQAAGVTSWTGADGLSWSVSGGAEISSRDYRYHGLMSSQPPRWDVTGADQYVAAQAGGPLRVLAQGSKPPVMSPIKRAVLAQSGSLAPLAYWPMEDGSAATSFGSATGGQAMTWNGTPTLATSTVFACSAPLPSMGGAALNGIVPSYTGTGTWAVRWLMDIPTLPSGEQEVFQVDCIGGALANYIGVFVSASGQVQLTAFDNALNVIADTGLVTWPVTLQQPTLWSLEAVPSGSNVQYNLVTMVPGGTTSYFAGATSSATGTAGQVATVGPVAEGGWSDLVIGHVQVQSAVSSLATFPNALSGPLGAWDGEPAGTRYARLAAENGWPVRVKGSPDVSAVMGQQGADTLANLLQSCELADLGQQYEPRECPGLGYRTLASMCNQAPQLTLSHASSQPGGVSGSPDDSGLDPSYDDLLSRNDWSVTRGTATGSQGSTVRAVLDDGSLMSITGPLGDYADTRTVAVQADSQLPHVAGWLVHLGTVDEHRWPAIPVNLARAEMASLQAAAMLVDAGDYVQVTSLPDQVLYDPAKQVALGFTEQLGGFHWTMEFQCAPESPYEVLVLDDPAYGRVDTDGSTLASGATAGATSLSVATLSGFPLWTTAAADFPFDIAISGERVTVTNITGSSSPQAFTVVRAVNGVSKAQASGADVRLWFPPVLALS